MKIILVLSLGFFLFVNIGIIITAILPPIHINKIHYGIAEKLWRLERKMEGHKPFKWQHGYTGKIYNGYATELGLEYFDEGIKDFYKNP